MIRNSHHPQTSGYSTASKALSVPDTRGNLRPGQGRACSIHAKPRRMQSQQWRCQRFRLAQLCWKATHPMPLSFSPYKQCWKNVLYFLWGSVHTITYTPRVQSLSRVVPSASSSYGIKLQMSSFNYSNNDLGSKIFPSLPQIFISSEINTTMCLLPTAGKLWSDWNDIILFSYGISVLWDFREKLVAWGGVGDSIVMKRANKKRWNCLK